MNQISTSNEDQRLAEIQEILLKFAAGDLAGRGPLADDGSVLDDVMEGINRLGDVLEAQESDRQLAKELAEQTAADQEVSSANEQLAVLLDSLPIAVYRCATEGDYAVESMSQNVVSFTGYTSRNFIDQSDLRFSRIHPDDAPRVSDEVKLLLEKGRHAYEYRWRKADGKYLWIRDSLRLVRFEDDRPNYLLGTWQDITEDKLAAEVLRKANDDLSLFRKVLDSSSDAIEVLDPMTLQFLDVNEAACRDLGYSREELLALSVYDIDPNSDTDFFQKVEKTMRESGAARFETTHRRKDGSIFPVEISMGTVTLGRFYGLAIVRDITDRKQAEGKIREQQQLTTQIIETIPLRVFWKDSDLRYLGCNTLFARDAGLSRPDELIGKTDFEMPWKDQAGMYRADDQPVMDTNSPKLSYDEPQTTPEGGLIWLRTSKVPLHNNRNETVGILGVYEDITTYKQVTQTLEESELRFRTILDAAVDGILVADAQNQALVTGNRAICNMLGYSMEELYDLGLEDLHPAEALPQVKLQFERQLLGETKVIPDMLVKRKDGSVFFADISTSPMMLGGGQFLVGVFHDVTERRQVEEKIRRLNEELEDKVQKRTQQLLDAQEELVRKEKLALLGLVASSVGHELRNPLGVMNNAVYFLQTLLVDADEITREYLEIIKSEIADADSIVADLLDSVRTKPPQPTAVSVWELINQTLCKVNMSDTMNITLDLPEMLPPVRVDARQIQQVLQNLISNGMDAMPEGGMLEIRAVENRPEGTVTLSVRDSGSGIAPEMLDKLFQPLFTTKARGIGLGLVVVKNLTEANGGTIRVESAPGEGSLFFVTLPSAADDRS